LKGNCLLLRGGAWACIGKGKAGGNELRLPQLMSPPVCFAPSTRLIEFGSLFLPPLHSLCPYYTLPARNRVVKKKRPGLVKGYFSKTAKILVILFYFL
jgi:hypothetical protein